jgi:hypothetical protein
MRFDCGQTDPHDTFDIDDEKEPIERSELVRYALRLGFQQAAPDKFETLREAVQEHATQNSRPQADRQFGPVRSVQSFGGEHGAIRQSIAHQHRSRL